MGCGASGMQQGGGRHQTLQQKQKTQDDLRRASVKNSDMAGAQGLDRQNLLKLIFESMDKDSNGFVDLAEFKETLACGLEAEWENKEVQALATAHYNEMDEMGNKNGQLELNEWMGRVMENGKDLTDAEFETSLEAWTALIKHKKAREAKPGE